MMLEAPLQPQNHSGFVASAAPPLLISNSMTRSDVAVVAAVGGDEPPPLLLTLASARDEEEAAMIPAETRAEICRLFFAEHLTMNTIAISLGIHHDTVQSVLALRGKIHTPKVVRASMLEPFLPIIRQRLEQVPNLRSTRLVQILRDRGYKGGLSQLRRLVATMRPKNRRAFATLIYFPGEEAQVDWASFGALPVGRAQRRLSCFVMTLCYSRATFALFTYDQSIESFFRGHVAAFHFLKGVPRILRYDNLKTAVIDRQGSAIRFHPHLLEMAGHYAFSPRACNVRAGWEKGRVERTIRYIRENFFAARTFRDIDDANAQLSSWLRDICNRREWPDDRRRSVFELWTEEQERLVPVAQADFPTDDVGPCRPTKQCYVRYDGNDYSVPYRFVGEILTLLASEKEIRIIDRDTEVARHVRSYSKGEKFRIDAHFSGMYEHKPQAGARSRRGDLIALIPKTEKLYEMMMDLGIGTGRQTTQFFALLEMYGKDAFAAAVDYAIERGLPRSSVCAQFLEREDKKKSGTTVPQLPITLPDHPQVEGTTVIPHALATYDAAAEPLPEQRPQEGATSL